MGRLPWKLQLVSTNLKKEAHGCFQWKLDGTASLLPRASMEIKYWSWLPWKLHNMSNRVGDPMGGAARYVVCDAVSIVGEEKLCFPRIRGAGPKGKLVLFLSLQGSDRKSRAQTLHRGDKSLVLGCSTVVGKYSLRERDARFDIKNTPRLPRTLPFERPVRQYLTTEGMHRCSLAGLDCT